MILKCIICGQEMEAQKSTKKYCSRSCENKARAQKQQLRKEAALQGIDIDIKNCLICGAEFKPRDKNANQRSCCYNCMPEGEQLMRSDFINLIRQQRGGKCEKCGYNRYLGALDFHHLNPSQKDFTVGNRDFKLKECIEETKKCIMLCSNCHRELHANLWTINDLNLEERDS